MLQIEENKAISMLCRGRKESSLASVCREYPSSTSSLLYMLMLYDIVFSRVIGMGSGSGLSTRVEGRFPIFSSFLLCLLSDLHGTEWWTIHRARAVHSFSPYACSSSIAGRLRSLSPMPHLPIFISLPVSRSIQLVIGGGGDILNGSIGSG